MTEHEIFEKLKEIDYGIERLFDRRAKSRIEKKE